MRTSSRQKERKGAVASQDTGIFVTRCCERDVFDGESDEDDPIALHGLNSPPSLGVNPLQVRVE